MEISGVQSSDGSLASPAEMGGLSASSTVEHAQAASAQQQAYASNLENSAAMLRAADAWMGAIGNLLGRMGELAVKAGDGALANVNRMALQREFAQMQQGIQAITTGPDAMGRHNGIHLFQGDTAFLAQGTNYSTPDLSASSSLTVGRNAAGNEVTWGELMTEANIATQHSAAEVAPELNLGLDRLGGLRNELGIVWSLVSPAGSPLNPSATAAASLADKLQYTAFYQTLNALGSGQMLLQA